MSAARPEASVLVPNFNGGHHLETCLGSLAASTLPRERYEVLLVDNASSDGSAELVRSRFPDVRIVRNPANLGFTGAVRRGAAEARGEILVLLNNDMRVSPGWLEALTASLRGAPPSVGTVTGKILSWEGDRLDFHRGVLTFDGHAFQLDFHRPLAEVAAANAAAELPFPCGGNMAVRRHVWEESDGFDDDFFAYTEDVDFGWRTWAAGWDHLYEPRAAVFHRSGATGASLGVYRRGYLFEKNAFMTAYKNFDETWFRRLMPAVLWTLLHRTWTLLRENNPGGARLEDFPFPPRAEAAAPPQGRPEPGIRRSLARLLRRIAGRLDGAPGPGKEPAEELVVRDPRSLEQLRSLGFLLGSLDALAGKRALVQSRRKRSDDEYFARFPLFLVPTYPGDGSLFAGPGFRSWLPPEVELVRRTLEQIGDLT